MKRESASPHKNRWVSIASILTVSCWPGCGSADLDVNIFLLNTEFFFDNLVGLAEVENRAVVVKVKSHLKKP